ncbi:MAG: class I SAM-dependent methyltransferase [Jatrophihabitantaceae bacterium]
MSTGDRLYTDRERAQSFGSVADAYDRYRPVYPDALIDDLVELGARRVLDVACGTGKIAVPLLACGMAVLGVEIDPGMAAVARRHGIIVEEGAFETWDDAGRRFDLITCGQAWHWIDPELGNAKAARLLNPGGTLALLWNYDDLDPKVLRAFEAVLRAHAPELIESDHRPDEDDRHVDDLKRTGLFESVHTRRYKWSQTLTADEWIGRLGTYSAYIRLPGEQRDRVLTGLREVIDSLGGSVDSRFGTYTISARIPE